VKDESFGYHPGRDENKSPFVRLELANDDFKDKENHTKDETLRTKTSDISMSGLTIPIQHLHLPHVNHRYQGFPLCRSIEL
jgi:hypothetical protein